MFESPTPQEGSENISREEVINSLRQNPDNLSVLQKFLEEKEKLVTNSKEVLNLNIEVAGIYRDAGLREAAIQAFEDAATQAWQENEDSLYEQLMDEADKLRE